VDDIENGGDRPGAPPVISRRRMLAWSLAAAATSGLGGVSSALDLARRAAAQQGTVVWAGLTRPQDQLDLAWELINVVRYRAGEGPGDRSVARIAVADPTQPAYIVVHFGPQSVAERAYFAVDPAYPNQGGDETALLTAPVPAALAGASRLAFRLPGGGPPVPYTVDGLLDWTELALSVVPAAARTVTGRPGPQEPAATQTALEVPWGLVLSPDDGAGWAHSRTPVTHGDRTELWHTRLGVRAEHGVDEHDVAHRTVRAVWTPGYRAWPVAAPDDLGPNPPQRTSLRPRQRYEIVRLSSDYSMDQIIPGGSSTKPYQPRPIAVNRLMLTPLGAWLDADGSWDVPLRPGSVDLVFAVEEWLHRATMGRDHQVKVVEAGFLFPFGHRAALVTVTERAFEPVRDPTTPTPPPLAAINRQRMFVVVREPERGYPGSVPNQPYGGRAMPWRTVRITTSVTPNLAAPDGPNAEPRTRVPSGPSTSYGSAAFWPMVPGAGGPTDFLFAMEGEDAQGRRCPFTAPLIFVRGGLSDSLDDTRRIVDAYAGVDRGSEPLRLVVREFEAIGGGRRLAYTDVLPL
jgi:hypothetical protein